MRRGVARIALLKPAPPAGGFTKGIRTAVLDLGKRQQRQLLWKRNGSLTPSNLLHIVPGQNPARFFVIMRKGLEGFLLGHEDSHRPSVRPYRSLPSPALLQSLASRTPPFWSVSQSTRYPAMAERRDPSRISMCTSNSAEDRFMALRSRRRTSAPGRELTVGACGDNQHPT